ncbi:MAG: phosphopantetheine-binding protein [Rhizomicrobium sp.]
MADALQQQVGAIWARALGVKTIKPDDNFFALGGHSLLGVKLIAEIQAKTGIEEEISLSDLLEFPTLAAFTQHLEI